MRLSIRELQTLLFYIVFVVLVVVLVALAIRALVSYPSTPTKGQAVSQTPSKTLAQALKVCGRRPGGTQPDGEQVGDWGAGAHHVQPQRPGQNLRRHPGPAAAGCRLKQQNAPVLKWTGAF